MKCKQGINEYRSLAPSWKSTLKLGSHLNFEIASTNHICLAYSASPWPSGHIT